MTATFGICQSTRLPESPIPDEFHNKLGRNAIKNLDGTPIPAVLSGHIRACGLLLRSYLRFDKPPSIRTLRVVKSRVFHKRNLSMRRPQALLQTDA